MVIPIFQPNAHVVENPYTTQTDDDSDSDDEDEVTESSDTHSHFIPLTGGFEMGRPSFLSSVSLPSGVDPDDFRHSRTRTTSAFTKPTPQTVNSGNKVQPTPRPTETGPYGDNTHPTTTSTNDSGVTASPGTNKKHGSGHGAIFAAAGIVPVVVIAIIGVIVFFYLRKRKRERRKALMANAQEMKSRSTPPPTIQPYYNSTISSQPTPPPPSQPQPHYAVPPPTTPPPAASPTTPQPVILGPIVPGSNGAYYTGIDTSDIVSVHDRTGLGNPFADGDDPHDEPPPPYRPRSIAPLSRDTSLRAPATSHSRTNLMENHQQPPRSPFADPGDDDAVSDVSGPTLRRERDAMSAVSDLSYQEDPVVVRPSV